MREEWKIREATIGDSVGLQRCMVSAYACYQARLGNVLLPPLDVDYSAEIKNSPTWVAESGVDIAGGLIMSFEQDHAVVSNIAVHPEFQGRGLGGEFMRLAEATARERHFSELRLSTHVLLTENTSLYTYLGWTEIDRDDVRVYMRKRI